MKNSKKNRRLLIQVGSVTLLIFVLSLVFSIGDDYSITRDACLSSKNEMIDRDLTNLSKDVKRMYTKWCLGFIREHRDEICLPMTEEEKEFQNSVKGNTLKLDAITKEDFDFEGQEFSVQK